MSTMPMAQSRAPEDWAEAPVPSSSGPWKSCVWDPQIFSSCVFFTLLMESLDA